MIIAIELLFCSELDLVYWSTRDKDPIYKHIDSTCLSQRNVCERPWSSGFMHF
jgi:hypothetical protein